MGGLRYNFELGPLGHDLAVSKGVGSKMEDRAGATRSQSRGKTPTDYRWLTATSSVSGLKASGLERLRVRVGPPFPYRFELPAAALGATVAKIYHI